MCDTPAYQSVRGPLSRRGFLGVSSGVAALSITGCTNNSTRLSGAGASAAQPSATTDPHRDTRFALVTLGVQGGPPPSAYHFGISSALVVNGKTYVVDCGRGSVSQFFRTGLDITSLAGIFITHLHVDHIIDYISYLQLCGGFPVPNQFSKPIFAYGPGSPGDLGPPPEEFTWAYDTSPGLEELTKLQMRAFAASANFFVAEKVIGNRSGLLTPHDIVVPPPLGAGTDRTAPEMEPFEVMEDDNVKVSATLVPHAKVFPAFAFRFDTEHGSVTFSGDTARSTNLVTLAHQTEVLVHEAVNIPWYAKHGAPASVLEHHKKSHTNIADVGKVASEAEARKLVISHIGPGSIPVEEWAAQLQDSCHQAGYRGKYQMAQDGLNVPIP